MALPKASYAVVWVSSRSWSGMVLWLRRRWCSCRSHLWHLVGHPAAFDRSPFQTFSKIQAFGTDSGARTGEAVDKGWQTHTKQWATWFVLDCFSLCIRQVRFSFCSIHRGPISRRTPFGGVENWFRCVRQDQVAPTQERPTHIQRLKNNRKYLDKSNHLVHKHDRHEKHWRENGATSSGTCFHEFLWAPS